MVTVKCELCGNTIVGPLKYVIVEGSKIITCSDCAKYSSGEWKPPKVNQRVAQRGRILARPKSEMVLKEETLRVIPSYSSVIREARERAGWSLEQLASRVGLKASQVRKIESGKLMPSLKEAKLFEHQLKVSLVTTAEAEGTSKGTKPQSLTIGDIIDFRERDEG
ncbi:MAG: multiprotein bridging factor aMBF1 [Thermoproteota archaeon]